MSRHERRITRRSIRHMTTQAIPTLIHTFRGVSSTTVWEAKNEFLAAGFIPAITGFRNGSRFQPRKEDIVILSMRETPHLEAVNTHL